MNDFLMFLLYFAAGYFVIRVAAKIIMYLISRYLERKLEEMQADLAEIQKTNVPCLVERHGDIFYIYDTRTGDFVAQGASLNEIREHIRLTRYRDLRIFVTEGEEDVIQALKGTQTDMEAGHA